MEARDYCAEKLNQGKGGEENAA
jgi:hypothetical protein